MAGEILEVVKRANQIHGVDLTALLGRHVTRGALTRWRFFVATLFVPLRIRCVCADRFCLLCPCIDYYCCVQEILGLLGQYGKGHTIDRRAAQCGLPNHRRRALHHRGF